ncbi:MAG TPA: hypothetical protein VFR50_04205 [Casimicrobiaceae bacterium]|nr:hypothetical protein [Casimicrobiaceae bacterium]
MFVVLAVMLALAQQRAAHAGTVFFTGSASLDTSALSGPFELVFVLTDGSGIGDANNLVELNDFAFGPGGGAGSVDTLLSTGGVSGDLTTGVALVDTAFFNVFASTFTPGSLLSFDFAFSTNIDGGGTPDQLSMALLQSDRTPVPSTDASGAVLVVNIDSPRPGFGLFATDLTPAPTVTFAGSAPEPPTALLLLVALLVSPRFHLIRPASNSRRLPRPTPDRRR